MWQVVALSAVLCWGLSSGQTCTDRTLRSGRPWSDARRRRNTCARYARVSRRCRRFGSRRPREGMTANDACCACGGGDVVETPAPAGCPAVRVRRAWPSLSCAERAQFIDAVRRYQEANPEEYRLFATEHEKAFDFAHWASAFLPWHRWFLVAFENALRTVSGHECITVPYWDAEWDAGNELDALPLRSTTFGSSDGVTSDGCVTEGVAAGWVASDGHCLARNFSSDGMGTFASVASVSSIIVGFPEYEEFRPFLEWSPHSAPHMFIGGQMDSPLSPSDPLFFVHHCNVDRLWAIWADFHGHSGLDKDNLTDWTYFPADDRRSSRTGQELDDGMPFLDSFPHAPSVSGGVTPRDMHDPSNMPGGVRVRYGVDHLAGILARDNDGPAVEWRWVTPATVLPVPRPECSGTDRRKATILAGSRRHPDGPFATSRSNDLYRRMRAHGASFKEALRAVAADECKGVSSDKRALEAYFRRMHVPSRERKYYVPCSFLDSL